MSDRIKKFFKEEGVYYGILAVMLLAFCIPYFTENLPVASENGFHYARLYSLAETLKLGVFPAKLRPMLMKEFGYGVGFFYPDFFSYFPALLIILGVDVIPAIKIFVIVAAIIGAIAIYRTVDRLVNNKRIAVIIDVLYFGTLCMWNNLYDGAGIGAFIAQLFLPMAFCGLIRALRDERSGYIEYAVSIVVVVLTHHLTFISMLTAMLMIVLMSIKNIIRNPKIIGKLFAVSFAGLFFTAQYWMPAIELAVHTKYKVIYDNFIDINDHILNFPEVIDNITLPYFIIFLVAAAFFIYRSVKNKKVCKEALIVLICTLIHIWLMCSNLFWRGPIGQFFAFFQSTERLIYVLMALILVFVAFVAGIAAEEQGEKNLIRKMNSAVLFIVCVALVLATRLYLKPDFYNPYAYPQDTSLSPQFIVDENGISCGEWLPVENEPSECHDVSTARADDGTSADGFKHDSGNYFEVWLLLDKQYYDMPYIYYYGYRAYIIDDNNNPIEELKVGEAYDRNGYVRVFMPEGREGVAHVMVKYYKTRIQKIAYLISIVTTVLLLGYAVLGKKRRSQK